MCGIGGILYATAGREALSRKMKRLADKQKHRGPDGCSEKIMDRHALCHQRLSLLDIKRGAQPFTDSTGRYVIVYNGEVYNYRELRLQLQHQYSFTTDCDTEVVLAAWIIMGPACLQQFNGMFAFLIWDTVTETGFAARDAMGVKPFVYTRQKNTFLFASEVKALLAVLDTQPGINEYALAEYVVAPYLSGDAQAIHRNISFLQPGEFLQISSETVTAHTWYCFAWQPNQLDEHTLAERVAEAMEQSVAMSMRADVSVGLFFSGGLDSSLIAAIAAEHAEYKPEAYTITFPQHETIHFDAATIVNANDLPYAESLAALLELPLHKVVAAHPSLEESIRLLAHSNDRIPAWEQEFAQHFLAHAASQHVKAVLVGDAADETHYGYFFLLKEAVNASPLGLLHLFGAGERVGLLHPRLQKQLQPLDYLDAAYRALVAEAGYDFGKGGEESILAMSTLVHRRWLQRLLHNGDIHTMHAGLEARVPFANRNVLDAASLVYPRHGFKNEMEKNVLRNAASWWLGGHFCKRKKSALPRDPRLGKGYQQLLQQQLACNGDFIDTWLNRPALEALSRVETITEQDRMMLFNMVSLICWAEVYAA